MPNFVETLVDISIGTWKLNLAKSKVTPPRPNPVTSLTMVYDAIEGGANVTVSGELEDGTAVNFAGPVRYDGKEYPITGAPWDTYSFTAIDAHACTFVDKKTGGKYHVLGRQVISEDGNTMTITSEGTDADGTPVTGIGIYERQ
jgi:hypothetical protein